MQTRRWVNPTQPQTLQIAVFLLYFTAVTSFLFGLDPQYRVVFHSGTGLLRLVLSVATAAAGYGIANGRRWAYGLGVVVAALPIAVRLYISFKYQISPLSFDVLGLMFEVALLALLLHPQSRDYQRIYFE
jgi:hypothetical protein